jgi:putative phage-type endonuclease
MQMQEQMQEQMQILSVQEVADLSECAGLLITELIQSDPMRYIQPTFHTDLVQDVTDLLVMQIQPLCTTILTQLLPPPPTEHLINDPEDLLAPIVEKSLALFYTHIAPPRSYPSSFVWPKKKNTNKKITQKIAYLQSIPQPEQRTPEWYAFRQKYLTASSIWKAFSSQSTKNQLIYEKCQPLNIEKYQYFSLESPMHWGQRYEPVSIMYYEDKYKTVISDFGCLPHNILPFLAASPDGINTSPAASRYGRMLEVKNIVNRIIDGIPKLEYWIQMQVQMEVCLLNECDFLETRFTEYESEAAFLADSPPLPLLEGSADSPPLPLLEGSADSPPLLEGSADSPPLPLLEGSADSPPLLEGSADSPPLPLLEGSADSPPLPLLEGSADSPPAYSYSRTALNELKGLILFFMKNGKPFYIYAPLNMTAPETRAWEETQMEKYQELTWMQTVYWKLAEVSCVLVLRNKGWFKAAVPILEEIWQTIQTEKISGYAHRAAIKKTAAHRRPIAGQATAAAGHDNIPLNTCLINIAGLF